MRMMISMAAKLAYQLASAETLNLVLAITTDIADKLLQIDDAAGANSLCILIRTLEQNKQSIPDSVAAALLQNT